LNAADYGLRTSCDEDISGGDPEENAEKMHTLLTDQDGSPCRDVVLLNAAATLSLVTDSFATALDEATQSLESGAALQKLDALAEMSQHLTGK
jgi:anthranilate phosphoribosyltransferase